MYSVTLCLMITNDEIMELPFDGLCSNEKHGSPEVIKPWLQLVD